MARARSARSPSAGPAALAARRRLLLQDDHAEGGHAESITCRAARGVSCGWAVIKAGLVRRVAHREHAAVERVEIEVAVSTCTIGTRTAG